MSNDFPTLMPYYSIVVPAFNESRRIQASLDRMLDHIRRSNWSAEIIVVDDGSTDNTANIVMQYAQHNSMVRLVRNNGNRGKGYTVRNGILKSRGELLLFTDADLSSPIEEAAKLFVRLQRGDVDVAIGSRYLNTALLIRKQPWQRRIFGRAFNLALRIALDLKYVDTQCGFKAFSREAAFFIFPKMRIERWGFDPEILFLAKRYGLRVTEVPVSWAHDHRSKINPLRDGIRMLGELMRVRMNSLTGKYAQPQIPAQTAASNRNINNEHAAETSRVRAQRAAAR